MKITRISLYRIGLPYVDGSYGWGAGNAIDTAMATVVVVDTDVGLSSFGQFTQSAPSALTPMTNSISLKTNTISNSDQE